MAKQNGIKVVLIGDTHPEMIAIARVLQTKTMDFRVFLSFYLTNKEFKKICKSSLVSKKMEMYFSKRVLSMEIDSEKMIRDFAIFELLIISLEIVGFLSLKNFFTKIAKKIRQFLLTIYLLVVKPQVVIMYDNINLRLPKSSKLIVIALMAHPLEVQSALAKAENDFPDWPKTVGNLNFNHSQIYARANQIIVLSNYAHLSFTQYGILPQKLKTINLGPKNKNNLDSRIFIKGRQHKTKVLFVGQINLRKGVPSIIEAAAELSLTHEFKIVGPSMNSVLSDYLVKSNLPKNIDIVVNPSHQQLDFEFRDAEVFVFPSYSEGFSLACIEAMSYGLIPVLSTNSGVCEALSETGLEDFSINPGSVEEIVEKLILIRELSDETFYKFRNLSASISRNYSLDKFAKQLLSSVGLS
jgi:glycosyltransferase involved in cell wall biosynthesis